MRKGKIYCNRLHRVAPVGRHAAAFRRGVVAADRARVAADHPARAHQAASFAATIRISKRWSGRGPAPHRGHPSASLGQGSPRLRPGVPPCVCFNFLQRLSNKVCGRTAIFPRRARSRPRSLRLKMNARERGCPSAPPARLGLNRGLSAILLRIDAAGPHLIDKVPANRPDQAS